MGRCRSDCSSVTECLCSHDSTQSIAASGSGASGFPFTYDAIISPTVFGNRLNLQADGLYVPVYPHCKGYAASDQLRATGEALEFDTNEVPGHNAMHDVGPPVERHYFHILETGWWAGLAAAACQDTNHCTDLGLRFEDQVTGDIIGQSNADQTPFGMQVGFRAWLTVGVIVTVNISFTGAGPIAIQGGGTYGHRTFCALYRLSDV